jgi:hypothetical protein
MRRLAIALAAAVSLFSLVAPLAAEAAIATPVPAATVQAEHPSPIQEVAAGRHHHRHHHARRHHHRHHRHHRGHHVVRAK